MHAHFNLQPNEPKNQRSNPLIKTSKISHSAKDIMKNMKAGGQGSTNHNDSTSTNSTSNSSMADMGGGKIKLTGNQMNMSHLPFIEPSRIS
jgi:hypothetical protein